MSGGCARAHHVVKLAAVREADGAHAIEAAEVGGEAGVHGLNHVAQRGLPLRFQALELVFLSGEGRGKKKELAISHSLPQVSWCGRHTPALMGRGGSLRSVRSHKSAGVAATPPL